MRFLDKLLNEAKETDDHDWGQTEFIYIVLAEPLEPDERHSHYGDALDAELKLQKLGYISGGGSSLSDENPDGSHDIEWSGLDVDTIDVDKARAVLREHLPILGCLPFNTARTANPFRTILTANAGTLLAREQTCIPDLAFSHQIAVKACNVGFCLRAS